MIETAEKLSWPLFATRDEESDAPATFLFGRARVGGSFIRGASGRALVSINEGRSALSLPAPQDFLIRGGRLMRLVLRDLPLPTPPNAATAGRLIQHGTVADGGIMVHTSVSKEEWNFDVQLPGTWKGLNDWALERGYQVKPSPPGRIAGAFLSRLGSTSRLSVFARREAITILRALATD